MSNVVKEKKKKGALREGTGGPSAEPHLPKPVMPASEDTQIIAFYLPQFHPIPENDLAWGKGFTEWFNVVRAKPLYRGHHQPHIPGELGFYDLRVPEIMEQQALLAKANGIYGFCYYYYWFDGRRLLEKPLEMMLANRQIDIPFCLCWANENWTRRWDGSEHEVIIAQTFEPEFRDKFIDDLIPYFQDERYIRIDTRPLILVYRPDIITGLEETITQWRAQAKKHGYEIFIAACLTFSFNEPLRYGFDVGVEFPPHGIAAGVTNDKIEWTTPFEGKAYAYSETVINEIAKPELPFPVFRTAMAGWDNTPRRGTKGHLFHEATPEKFETWLSALVLRSKKQHRPGERLVFVNAWNEWAEGAHLEPDHKYGRQWLLACSRAAKADVISIGSDIEADLAQELIARADNGDTDPAVKGLIDLYHVGQDKLRSVNAVNVALSEFYFSWLNNNRFSATRPLVPSARLRGNEHVRRTLVTGWIERPDPNETSTAWRTEPFYVSGWICPSNPISPEALRCILTFIPFGPGEPHSAVCNYLITRNDDFDLALPEVNRTRSGFEAFIDLRAIQPGDYTVVVGLSDDEGIAYMPCSLQLFVS